MSRVWPYQRRAPRTLFFWLVLLLVVVAVVRAIFPREGFDEVRTGDQPIEVAAGADGIWVLNFGDHTVSLVDPESADEVLEVEIGDDAAPALSANGDGAWVLLDGGAVVARVDADSGTVEDRVDLSEALDGDPAQDLAAGDGFVWITTGEAGSMVRLDTGTGALDEPVDLGQAVAQPQIVGDALWIHRGDGVAEHDAATGEERQVLDTVASRVHDFHATEDAVYLLVNIDALEETGVLVRMDPDNEEQSSESAPRRRVQGSTPTHLTVAGDRVFVTGTGGMVHEFAFDDSGELVAVASDQVAVSTKDLRTVVLHDGVLWVADGTNGVVHESVDELEGEVTTDDEGLPGAG